MLKRWIIVVNKRPRVTPPPQIGSILNVPIGVGTRADSQLRLEVHVISSPDLRDKLGARFRMITDDNLIGIALKPLNRNC
jgi:hypothetical protein